MTRLATGCVSRHRDGHYEDGFAVWGLSFLVLMVENGSRQIISNKWRQNLIGKKFLIYDIKLRCRNDKELSASIECKKRIVLKAEAVFARISCSEESDKSREVIL